MSVRLIFVALWPRHGVLQIASVVMLTFVLTGGYFVQAIPVWISWLKCACVPSSPVPVHPSTSRGDHCCCDRTHRLKPEAHHAEQTNLYSAFAGSCLCC